MSLRVSGEASAARSCASSFALAMVPVSGDDDDNGKAMGGRLISRAVAPLVVVALFIFPSCPSFQGGVRRMCRSVCAPGSTFGAPVSQEGPNHSVSSHAAAALVLPLVNRLEMCGRAVFIQ